jgi:hypothetical protein
MNIKQIYRATVALGRAADEFAIKYPDHRIPFRDGASGSLFAAARDLATGIENGCRSLSVEALQRISQS